MPFRLIVNGKPLQKVFATSKDIHDFFATGAFEEEVTDAEMKATLGAVGISSIMPLRKSKIPPTKLSNEVVVTSSVGGRRKTRRRTARRSTR
jgi:hypothetical protein